MFLHCVAENRGEVVAPWRKFQWRGDNLFAFRIVLGFILFSIIVAGLITGYTYLMRAASAGDALGVVTTLAAVIVGTFVVSIPVIVVTKFTTDFVVPIMYIESVSCVSAWRRLLELLSDNKMRFLLYLLFQIVIWLIVLIVVVGFACVTLGCACCFFALPYIGTVALLPILVFERSYSLYYIRQYGPAFDVFRAEERAAEPA
jgi:hypothetical protein